MVYKLLRTLRSAVYSDKNANPAIIKTYISAGDTVLKASEQNLSVCDYVEKVWGISGQTQAILNKIFSVVEMPVHPTVLEIGTGTGRYLEKTLENFSVKRYDSYEIADDWNEFLTATYPAVNVFKASGHSLSFTNSESVDLLMAHGVFVYLPLLTSLRYFNEMARVVKQEGYCVFDCFTEDCLSETHLQNWINSNHEYPVLLPKKYLIDRFKLLGFDCVFSFTSSTSVGISRHFIFKKVEQF